jgi:uncharacterized membrane protein
MDPDTRYGTALLSELRDRSVPPLDVDVDRAMATGRRRVRVRRTVIGVVAAATGLAVVAGTLVALDSIGGRRADEPAPQVAQSAPATVSCSVRALPVPPGEPHASPMAVDSSGRYVVGHIPGSEETGAAGAALLWDGDRVRDLAVPGQFAAPSGVNSAGTVVGTVNRNHRQVPWVYRDGAVITLPAFNGLPTSATAINDRGDIVGTAYGERDRNTAVVWPADRPATVRALTAPGSAGANAIAADGTIVGYGDENLPYVWGPDGAGRPLPILTAARFGAVRGIADSWAYGYLGAQLGDTSLPDPGGKVAGSSTRRWSVRWNLADGRVEELTTVEPTAVTTGGVVAGISAEVKRQRPFRAAVVQPGPTAVTLPPVNPDRNYNAVTAGTPDGRVYVGEETTDSTTTPLRWTC